MLTCYTCVKAVLHKLACCYLVLDNNNKILFSKVIFTLSSKEVVKLPLIKSNRTSLFTISINKAIYSI
jgi:hypothetical protein